MKNFSKACIVPFFGIASALIIGFLITACDTEEEEIATDGRLTINGLGNYIGVRMDSNWDVWANVGEFDLFAVEKVITGENSQDIRFYAAEITGHSLTLKVYAIYRDSSGITHRHECYGYNGNDKNVTFNFRGIGTVTVDFTDGVGVGDFVPSSNN